MKEKINELDMSDELKEQISKLLLESSEEEEETIDEIEVSLDDILEQGCGEEDCDENCECRYTLNVISGETRRTLEIIDSIENPEEKFKWLTLVKNEILKEEVKPEAFSPVKFVGYDFNKILKKCSRRRKKNNC